MKQKAKKVNIALSPEIIKKLDENSFDKNKLINRLLENYFKKSKKLGL